MMTDPPLTHHCKSQYLSTQNHETDLLGAKLIPGWLERQLRRILKFLNVNTPSDNLRPCQAAMEPLIALKTELTS